LPAPPPQAAATSASDMTATPKRHGCELVRTRDTTVPPRCDSWIL
jgi:hypothetical protein